MNKFKVLIFGLLFTLISTVSFADRVEYLYNPVVKDPTAIHMDTRAYASLAATVTAAGASEVKILINKTETVTSDLTIPATVTLCFGPLGQISISAGKNVDILTPKIESGPHAIFAGSGDFDFADGTVLESSWFSTVSAAISYIGSSDLVTLVLTESYALTGDMTITSNINLKANKGCKFSGAHALTINGTVEVGDIQIFDVSTSLTVEGLSWKNVKWFGAVGDYSNDDTAAFVECVRTAGTVYIPFGGYKITSTITISTSNVHLLGELRKPIIWAAISGGVSDAIVFTTAAPTTAGTFNIGSVQNLAIYSSSAITQTAGCALKVIKHSNFYVNNYNARDYPIGLQLNGVRNSKFSNMSLIADSATAQDAGCALLIHGAQPASVGNDTDGWINEFVNVSIDGNSLSATGIRIDSGQALHFTNMYLSNITTYNLYMKSTSSGVTTGEVCFTNCYFDNPADYGAYIDDDALAPEAPMSSIRFSNCDFGQLDSKGIYIANSHLKGITITGCKFSNIDDRAIDNQSSSCNLNVVGNMFFSCFTDGGGGYVVSSDASKTTVISNNTFYNATAIASYGIQISGTHDSVVISGNTFDDLSSGGVLISSPTINDDIKVYGNVGPAQGNVEILGSSALLIGAQKDLTQPQISSGAGSPENAITAVVGSIYLRNDGGANTSIYIKESGTGNTGWVAK